MRVNAPQHWDARSQSGNPKLQTHSGRAMLAPRQVAPVATSCQLAFGRLAIHPPKPSCIRTTKGP